MATYHGIYGSLTYNGSTVAQITRFELMTDQDIVDTTTMGLLWGTVAGGVVRGSGNLECLMEYLTGQKELMDDAFVGTTPSVAGVTAVFTLGTTKTITATIIPRSQRLLVDKGDVHKLSVDFVLSGQPVMSWT